MSKARTLADFISDGSEFADGTISVAEVSGAAPTASPTFTGTVNTSSGSNSTDALKITGNGGNNFIHMVGNQGQTSFRMWENGAEDPAYFYMYHQGVEQHKIQSKGGESVVFNEKGLNLDFRVEGDTRDHLLFVDASTDRVGVGVSSPASTLHIVGDATDQTPVLKVVRTQANASNDTYTMEVDSSAQTSNITSAGAFNVQTSEGKALTIYGNGTIIINQDGNDNDVRVESDTHAHFFLLDGSNNRIGMGQAVPSSRIHMGDSSNGERITMSTNGGGGSIKVTDTVNNPSSGYTVGHLNGTDRYELDIGTIPIFRMRKTEVNFNDGSVDQDFRVESDGNSGMLHVDAANNSVNIGTTTSYGSGYYLNVNGKARINTGGSTPDNTSDSGFKGLLIQGGNQRLNIDVSNASNGGAYIQTRHQAVTTYPDAYYDLKLNPLGGRVIINEAGHTNADFRAETSADTEKFFIDAGADEIKMGLGNSVHTGLQFMGGGSERLNINYNGSQKVAIRSQSAPGGNDTDVLSIQTYSNGNYYDRLTFTRNGAIIEQPGSPNSTGLNHFMRKQHFYGSSAFNNPTLDLVSGDINTAAYPQCMIYIKCYQMGVASNRALITEAMVSIGGGSGTFYTTAIDGFSHVKKVNTSSGLGSLNVVTSGTAWTLQWTGNRVTNYDRYWLEVEVVHHQGMSNVAFAL